MAYTRDDYLKDLAIVKFGDGFEKMDAEMQTLNNEIEQLE